MDYLSYVIAIEELSRVCASHGVIASVNNSLVCYPIMTYGNEAQKQKYLVPLAKGEWLGAYCLTEPNAGSNAANQQTTAVADGDHYVLNGTKMFITNAGPGRRADRLRRDRPRRSGRKGITAFIVDADTPGVKKGKKEQKLGIHASDTREIAFENARVPKENLLGEFNKGYTVALATLGGGRIGIAAQALGHRAGRRVEAAVQATPASASSSTARSASSTRSARCSPTRAIELETARLLVYQAAWLRDQGRPHVKEASLAKWHASEAATPLRELGDPGARRLRLPDRVPRRALLARRAICEIYEGTTEVQKMVVAGQVLKEHALATPDARLELARRRPRPQRLRRNA